MNLKQIQQFVSKVKKNTNTNTIVPILSGGASLWLFNEIISSKLSDWRFLISMITVGVIFFLSVFLFGYLKWLEKEKDQHLLNTVGKIVEDVFKHYGVAMASNAAGPTIAKQMNPTMQTIVNLVEGLQKLAGKTYTK